MLWKNIVVLAALAWVTSTYAGKIAKESMDDAFVQKIERGSASKVQKRGVANNTSDQLAKAQEAP